MIRRNLCCFLLLVALSPFSRIVGQIALSQTAGCVPFSVNFTAPPGSSNHFWNFGKGPSPNTQATPSEPYVTPGIYLITYTGVVNGSPVTYTAKVTASGLPSGSMSYVLPTSHCNPMAVNFSASGGSPGSTISWAFGDLTPVINGASVTHTYTQKGAFKPVAIVIDAVTGCSNVATSSGTIYVSDPPQLFITSSKGLLGCNPPFTTSLDGSGSISGSPLGGALTQYNWTMNVGSPPNASVPTPGPTTFLKGKHIITLQATDNNQCTGVTSVTLDVIDPKLSVAVQPTVCIGAMVTVTLQSTTSPLNYTHTGSKGNNNSPYTFPINTPTVIGTGTATAHDTVAIFDKPGANSFTFEILPGGLCAPIRSVIAVYVESVTADFVGIPPTSTCNYSMLAVYNGSMSATNTSLSLIYDWAIDGGNSTNIGLPTTVTGNPATFSLYQGSKNPYTIYRNWTPKIILNVTSTSIAKCSASMSKTIYDTIRRPTAWFETSVQDSCGPLVVSFRDSSFTLMSQTVNVAANPITGYTLYSGGGTPSFVAVTHHSNFPITFTYSSPGTYTPQMVITTTNGCIDWSFVDTIRVVVQPTVSITSIFPTGTVCPGQLVTVNMTATPSSTGVTNWHVATDDGFFSGCVSDKSPSFGFTHVGTHGFTVTGQERGCKSEPYISPQTIVVRGPVGSVRYKTTCSPSTRKTITFDILLQEASSALFHFGDNTPPIFLTGNGNGDYPQSIVHTYSASGNYTATLISANPNSGCGQQTVKTEVTVRELEAKIKLQNMSVPLISGSIGCKIKRFVFDGSLSTDALIGCNSGYTWFIKNPDNTMHLPYVSGTPTVATDTFFTKGNYDVTLIVKDINMCSDTERVTVRISEVVPEFTFNANPFCMSNGSVQVINTTPTTQVGTDHMTNYYWDFGNGTLTTTGTDPDPLWQYIIQPGNQIFTVTLTGTNNVGCSGTTSTTLQINNPYPDLKASAWTPCLPKGTGSVVAFSALAGYASYSISYGDPGSTGWVTASSLKNHPHNYTVPGMYTVSVKVQDAAGCIGIEDRVLIAIGQPTAQIKFPGDKNKGCYPDNAAQTLFVDVKTNVTPVNKYIWQQGNNTPVTASNSIPPTVEKGITIFKVTVSVDGFCPSVDTALVILSDPRAKPVLEKNKVCLNSQINVSLKDTADIESWEWAFGDNVKQPRIFAISPLALFNPTLAYTYSIMPLDSMGKTTVLLIYSGVLNSCPRASTLQLQIIDVSAAFKHQQDIYRHCLGSTDAFISTMRNPAGHNLEYLWDFGDNSDGQGQTISHQYKTAGQYRVLHKVREKDFGCEDQLAKTMTILPLPVAALDIDPEMICPEKPFNVVGSGTPGVSGLLTGTLVPSVSFTFDARNTFSTQAMAAESTTYTLKVTDENNCVSEPDTAVILVPLRAKEVHWDTLVIIGQPVTINAFSGSNFTYTWSPLIENLSCINCYDPVATTTAPLTYTVEVMDQPLQCFITKNTYEIRIDPRISLDVPSAFTPNSDGVNDIVFPDGWGIRSLVYFRIFNRWGQLLFESNDLKVGWDGTFQGVPQNTDTYVYQVLVDTYKDERLSKEGTVKLLR